jgi:hypothetical protein
VLVDEICRRNRMMSGTKSWWVKNVLQWHKSCPYVVYTPKSARILVAVRKNGLVGENSCEFLRYKLCVWKRRILRIAVPCIEYKIYIRFAVTLRCAVCLAIMCNNVFPFPHINKPYDRFTVRIHKHKRQQYPRDSMAKSVHHKNKIRTKSNTMQATSTPSVS